jgi:hypothetical protein
VIIEPELVVEPESIAVVEVIVEPESAPEPELIAEMAPIAEPELTVGTDTVPPGVSRVDDLFARIRESRSHAVAQAHEVLDGPEPAGTGVITDEEARPRRRVAEREPLAVQATPTAPDSSPETDDEPDDSVDATNDPDAALLVRAESVLEPIELVVARKLKRALNDEQNDVQDVLRRARSVVTVDDLLVPADEQAQHYLVAVDSDLLDAARGILPVSSVITSAEPTLESSADALSWSVTVSLVSPLRERLRRSLEEADDPADQVDRVRGVYRDIKAQRIEPLARELVRLAANRAVLDHSDTIVRWVVDPIHGCCPDCVDNSLAEDVSPGDEFPTGAKQPPAHASCRCLLVSVHQ